MHRVVSIPMYMCILASTTVIPLWLYIFTCIHVAVLWHLTPNTPTFSPCALLLHRRSLVRVVGDWSGPAC